MSWLARLVRWGRARLGQPSRLATVLVEDLPETPAPATVYLVGVDGQQWIAAFMCPCNCGEFLQMSLLPGRPRWHATLHWDGTTSLLPSVWRMKGCRSHFFLRHGCIDWV